MPRLRKNMLTVKNRLERSTNRHIYKFKWVDPFPEIHGTLPEKMVYAELTRRGIPFLFLNDLRFVIPEIEIDKWIQADFVIPSLKIIIEVQGARWHSTPEAIESDAYKFAIYQTTGWKPLAWWDFDIETRLQDLFFESVELTDISTSNERYGKTMELPVERRTKIDTSKGIRTLNQRRFKAKMAPGSRRKMRKAINSYGLN